MKDIDIKDMLTIVYENKSFVIYQVKTKEVFFFTFFGREIDDNTKLYNLKPEIVKDIMNGNYTFEKLFKRFVRRGKNLYVTAGDFKIFLAERMQKWQNGENYYENEKNFDNER